MLLPALCFTSPTRPKFLWRSVLKDIAAASGSLLTRPRVWLLLTCVCRQSDREAQERTLEYHASPPVLETERRRGRAAAYHEELSSTSFRNSPLES